jgi:glycosyltransferase involved in cell wall biosynthesis
LVPGALAQALEALGQLLMRVLHVIPGRRDDPVSMVFVRRQVESIASQGVDCVTCFLEDRVSPSGVLRGWQTLRRSIAAANPDLVHAHFGTVTGVTTVLATRLPIVVTYRGSDLNPDPSVGAVRSVAQKLLSQLSALGAGRIICVSNQLVRRLWWRRARAIVIPSGIDLDLFRPIDRAWARRELAWSDVVAVAFFNAGRPPWHNKRPDLAEAAVAEASRQLGRNVRLHMLVGETPPQQIPVLMNACDCVLMTSNFEGSPNVVKEAMACNVPVVAVDVGDTAERLAGVSPSFIVERNAEALGSAIAEIVKLERRSNGREKALEVSQTALAGRIVNVYREYLAC